MVGCRCLFAFALALAPLVLGAAGPDPQQLLRLSDQARGGGLPGLVWEVTTVNSGSKADPDDLPMRLLIKAVDSSSLAETLEPLRSKGGRMLQVDRNMWLTKPGLTKPVPISPRQRLTGQAAIGDIAATNYAKDYTPALVREEDVRGERCYLLALRASGRQSTYDRIDYWVSAARGLALRADFLALSGKKLKSAEFDYDNRIELQGRTIPFVSRMVISDALTDARTTLEYHHVTIKAVPPSTFDVSHLE